MQAHRHLRRGSGTVVALLCVLAAGAVGTRLHAQSTLDRTPNVQGGWTGGPNTLHFNFLHRFNHSGAPQRQVMNRPTFLLGYDAPFNVLLGVHYATRSDVAANLPNEWELFARYAPLGEERGHALTAAFQGGYNAAAQSVDGELSLARRVGPLRLLAAGRVFSSGYEGDTRYAVAGGASMRLTQWIALAADAGTLLDRLPGEEPTWGAGIQLGIPMTPHSLSIQATNTNSATLQGAARGAKEVRWGFEFTVPVALRRYFGRRTPPAAVADAGAAEREREALVDSVRAAVRTELEAAYLIRWRADSLRFALRDDSIRLAQQLAQLREQERQDSIRRAEQEALRRVTLENQRREEERRAAQQPVVRAAMRNLAYVPTRIVIDAGTTIEWRNDDQVEHTVTANDRSWDSGIIRPGGTWRRRFDRPGTYDFFCAPHPFMTGVVIVRERQ